MFCPRGNQINVKLPGINLDAGTQSSHRATEKQRSQPNDNVEFADAASASPEVEDRKHPTLWFPDGTLTVVSSDGLKFRLHPGLLAHHSEILGGRSPYLSMHYFTDAGPPSEATRAMIVNEEIALNLPENGDDLGEFFNMIYNGGTQTIYYNPQNSITFTQFHRILRLGVKYEVQHIVKSGFARVEQAFPSDFDTWCHSDKTYNEYTCPIEMEPEDVIPLIILARDAKCTKTLPVMLYVCTSKVDSIYLLEGVSYTSEIFKLGVSDQMACMDARRRLQTIEAGTEKIFIRGAFDGPTSQCTTRQACITVCKHLVLKGEEDELLHDVHPFGTWDEWIDETEEALGEGRLCGGCKEHLKSEIKNYLRKEWERLGEIFNVPDWTPTM